MGHRMRAQGLHEGVRSVVFRVVVILRILEIDAIVEQRSDNTPVEVRRG